MRTNQWTKAIVVLSMILAHIPLRASAQFVEEIGTLESIYESRARQVLNSFLRPQEYSVVVSADIERDEKRLEEYREKMEIQFLPGLPIPADPSQYPVNNKLHSLKSRIEISLVLSPEVAADKEQLLKDLLISKLHLDEGSGDKITISRSVFPRETPQRPPQILPEFSWKTWSLILLLALLALAGLVFWASRKQAKREEEQEAEERKELLSRITEQVPERENDKEEPSLEELIGEAAAEEVKATESVLLKKIEDEEIEEDITETKERIIAMSTQYPMLASKAIRDLLESGRESDMVNVMETIGWDMSKKLFHNLGARAWGRVGAGIRRREELPKRSQYRKSISDTHRAMLAKVLEAGGGEKDEENPFGFLVKASPDERRQLLKTESPLNLAVISWFCNQGELGDFFESLETSKQAEITLAMARLDELPGEAVRMTAQKLVENLNLLRQKPILKAEGPRLAAQVLRTFAPEKELEILKRIFQSNPKEGERIRRATVQFTDLNMYPNEVVSEALNDVESELLTVALSGCEQAFVQDLLASMPKKKAMMIERDLQSNAPPPLSQVGLSRRNIVSRVESQMRVTGLTLDDIWSRIDAAQPSQGLRVA